LKDNEFAGIGNHIDYGARGYDPRIARWNSVDPLSGQFPSLSPYAFAGNSPILVEDETGREPTIAQAGTVDGFVVFFNNTRTKMGTLRGRMAGDAMIRLGSTTFNWEHMRPEPASTAPFNAAKDRYIYTRNGGWIDMVHFLFYAGKAYNYKEEGKTEPMMDAIKDGYHQEFSDKIVAPQSAYSYEDLPSDKFGAEFGAYFFDSKSNLTLGEQVRKYLEQKLDATNPHSAPNYSKLPKVDTKNRPTATNHSTNPMYTTSGNDGGTGGSGGGGGDSNGSGGAGSGSAGSGYSNPSNAPVSNGNTWNPGGK
jgi:RHS repeat-associated protein